MNNRLSQRYTFVIYLVCICNALEIHRAELSSFQNNICPMVHYLLSYLLWIMALHVPLYYVPQFIIGVMKRRKHQFVIEITLLQIYVTRMYHGCKAIGNSVRYATFQYSFYILQWMHSCRQPPFAGYVCVSSNHNLRRWFYKLLCLVHSKIPGMRQASLYFSKISAAMHILRLKVKSDVLRFTLLLYVSQGSSTKSQTRRTWYPW